MPIINLTVEVYTLTRWIKLPISLWNSAKKIDLFVKQRLDVDIEFDMTLIKVVFLFEEEHKSLCCTNLGFSFSL